MCHRVQLGVESVLGSVLESVLRAYLGAYSQAGWECAIEYNCECPSDHARECTWDRTVMQAGNVPSSTIERVLESMPRSVLGSILRAYLRA